VEVVLSFVCICMVFEDPVTNRGGGGAGGPFTFLTPPPLFVCPKPETGFLTSYVVVFLCSVRSNCSFC